MPSFQWKGKARDGTVKEGVIVAESSEAVMAALRAQAIAPTKIQVKGKDLSEYLSFLAPGVNTKTLVVFTRLFATMIDAGLPLVQCLDILSGQEENPTFKKVIRTVKSDVESGATFADALGKHPKVFDRLYVSLVSAGEIGGVLDTILNRVAGYMEKNQKLRSKVKGALVYPVAVSVVAFGIVIFMLWKVIPVFEKMFADFGGILPGPTQVVVMLSHWVQSYILYMMVGIVALVFLMRYIYSTKGGRKFFDHLFLRLPVFGDLLRKVAVARFSRTLSTMLSSGVPILDGLEIVARAAGNVVVEREVLMAKASIAEGKTIAEPLSKSRVFPGMVVQMISVGEQTGAVDEMLSKIAEFYEEEVDHSVDALTQMLEPIMMVGLGGTVGSLLIAMYLPIFKIAETVG